MSNNGFASYPITPFIIDKIYSSRKEMEDNTENDGVALSRYVLIRYCDEVFDQETRKNLHEMVNETINKINGIEYSTFEKIESEQLSEQQNKYLDNFVKDKNAYAEIINTTASDYFSFDQLIWKKEIEPETKHYKYYPVSNTSISYAPSNWRTDSGVGTPSSTGGEVFNDYVNTQAYGNYSHAEGNATLAASWGGHSEGMGAEAYGVAAHAEGTKTIATGNGAHAENYQKLAAGSGAHAEGFSSTEPDLIFNEKPNKEYLDQLALSADLTSFINSPEYTDLKIAWDALQEGNSGYGAALGLGAHSEGIDNVAVGYGAHAEGRNTWAEDQGAHAEGNSTKAFGWSAHAEGILTTVKVLGAQGEIVDSYGAHAEGNGASANGPASHSEGYNTRAKGYGSHAEGSQTEAKESAAHAEGKYTIAEGKYAHGEGEKTRAQGQAAHSEGKNTLAKGNYSHAEGERTLNEDLNNERGAQGQSSHSEGKDTIAKGNYSHAEGENSTAEKASSHAEGKQTIASGDYSHSEGGYNTASGAGAHAEGTYTLAQGVQSHAEGHYTRALGAQSHAAGVHTIADQPNQTVVGQYNEKDIDNALFTVGNGTSTQARSNAFYVAGNSTNFRSYIATDNDSTNLNAVVNRTMLNEFVNTSIEDKVGDWLGGEQGQNTIATAVEQAISGEVYTSPDSLDYTISYTWHKVKFDNDDYRLVPYSSFDLMEIFKLMANGSTFIWTIRTTLTSTEASKITQYNANITEDEKTSLPKTYHIVYKHNVTRRQGSSTANHAILTFPVLNDALKAIPYGSMVIIRRSSGNRGFVEFSYATASSGTSTTFGYHVGQFTTTTINEKNYLTWSGWAEVFKKTLDATTENNIGPYVSNDEYGS